jgi:hypothetical protein
VCSSDLSPNPDAGPAQACVAFAGVGQSCYIAPCGPGLHCDDLHKCRDGLDVGGNCPNNSWCKSTLACRMAVGDGGWVGNCGPFANNGDFCTGTEQCAKGLLCDTTFHQCLASSVPVGWACTSAQTCKDGSYCKGASGTTLGVCTLPTRVGAGQHCASVDPVCMTGLYCSPSAAQCVARVGPAGACSVGVSGQCKDHLACVGGVCTPKLAVDADCTVGTCLDIYACDGQSHTCKGLGAFRAPCVYDFQCQSHNCSVGNCAAPCLP